jgi:undecaprenyl-diphosphatase
LDSFDLVVLKWLYAGAWPAIAVQVVIAVTFLGSGWMMLPLASGLFWRRWRVPVASVTLLLLATAAVVASVKALARRTRPCNALAWAHVLPLDFPTDPSFPSGHSAGSFAFACFVFGLNRKAGTPLLFVAAFVALSRVALGMHYPSDVAAGAALGAALGSFGARYYRARRMPELGAVPAQT